MTKKKAVKKQDDLTGKIVQLTKDQGFILSQIIDKCYSLEFGMGEFANRLRLKKQQLWETIFDFRPELENYHCKYNGERNEVTAVALDRKKGDKK